MSLRLQLCFAVLFLASVEAEPGKYRIILHDRSDSTFSQQFWEGQMKPPGVEFLLLLSCNADRRERSAAHFQRELLCG